MKIHEILAQSVNTRSLFEMAVPRKKAEQIISSLEGQCADGFFKNRNDIQKFIEDFGGLKSVKK